MSIQRDFQEAADEWGRQIEEKAERDRLSALAAESRHEDNAEAFAAAVENAFSNTELDDEAEE